MMMDKKSLRAHIRRQKLELSEEAILSASENLTAQFLAHPLYQKANTIYGYLPYNQEVRTWALLEQALKDGKTVAVPKVYGDEMRFIVMTDLSRVAAGYAGIPEPVEDAPIANDPTGLVLMPGMVFDKQGHRIGYGGGFYDRFLAAEPNHPTIALCYEFQLLEHIPTEEFDIPVDCVLWA